jgi:hypothetical protein
MNYPPPRANHEDVQVAKLFIHFCFMKSLAYKKGETIHLNNAYPFFLDDLKEIRRAMAKDVSIFLPCREIFYIAFEYHVNKRSLSRS